MIVLYLQVRKDFKYSENVSCMWWNLILMCKYRLFWYKISISKVRKKSVQIFFFFNKRAFLSFFEWMYVNLRTFNFFQNLLCFLFLKTRLLENEWCMYSFADDRGYTNLNNMGIINWLKYLNLKQVYNKLKKIRAFFFWTGFSWFRNIDLIYFDREYFID